MHGSPEIVQRSGETWMQMGGGSVIVVPPNRVLVGRVVRRCLNSLPALLAPNIRHHDRHNNATTTTATQGGERCLQEARKRRGGREGGRRSDATSTRSASSLCCRSTCRRHCGCGGCCCARTDWGREEISERLPEDCAGAPCGGEAELGDRLQGCVGVSRRLHEHRHGANGGVRERPAQGNVWRLLHTREQCPVHQHSTPKVIRRDKKSPHPQHTLLSRDARLTFTRDSLRPSDHAIRLLLLNLSLADSWAKRGGAGRRAGRSGAFANLPFVVDRGQVQCRLPTAARNPLYSFCLDVIWRFFSTIACPVPPPPPRDDHTHVKYEESAAPGQYLCAPCLLLP